MRHPRFVRAGAAVVIAVCALAVGALGRQPEPASATLADVPAAISSGVSSAASKGITQYVAVIDRATGQLVGSTANCHTPVASESLFKLFEAAYYLRAYGGSLPAGLSNELRYMIAYSDDAIASKYWRADITGNIASVYGLSNTYNNPSRPGYWGATRVSACDMATFMWRMSNDPLVAGWLMDAMRGSTTYGSDGFNQYFGWNTLDGDHGAKQGWGNDSSWTGGPAIHSVGFSDKLLGAVLSTGPDNSATFAAMRDASTFTTKQVVAASRANPPSIPGYDNPTSAVGAFEQSGTVYFDGWAFDGNNLAWAMPVTVSIDGGASSTSTIAALPSPELAAMGIPGNHRFFAAWSPTNTGYHRACLNLPNYGAGSAQYGVSCIDVYVQEHPERDDPQGYVTGTTVSADGIVKVTGYAYDPSNLYASTATWLAWDGRLVGTPIANAATPSLAPYGIPGAHGIQASFAAATGGPHQLCLYVVNIGFGKNVWTSCRTVTVPPESIYDPRGDFTITDSAGGITAVGWAFDQSAFGTPVTIMWTVDGTVTAYSSASLPSEYLYPYGVGGQHGVLTRLNAGPGKHSVCMFAINFGSGTDQLTTCRDVTVS
ncbi:hypothetical protein [Cumulibacter manganitolerans]|uniref:hypothetical protein n=1 Tax=Cumulibacter manganitolerans TaxID=1884992 RepID=UPI00129722FC|nr:hypothetical protein [Cumulibacter manganitolerans]